MILNGHQIYFFLKLPLKLCDIINRCWQLIFESSKNIRHSKFSMTHLCQKNYAPISTPNWGLYTALKMLL